MFSCPLLLTSGCLNFSFDFLRAQEFFLICNLGLQSIMVQEVTVAGHVASTFSRQNMMVALFYFRRVILLNVDILVDSGMYYIHI